MLSTPATSNDFPIRLVAYQPLSGYSKYFTDFNSTTAPLIRFLNVEQNDSNKLTRPLLDVGWVSRAVCGVTHQPVGRRPTPCSTA